MYRLNNWSVSVGNDPYIAPEKAQKHLCGIRDNENRSVITSPITKVNRRVITTESGSEYYLEEPDPEYLEYLESIGYSFDAENPIKDKCEK